MFFIVSTIIAVILDTFNNIALPMLYKNELKKRGKIYNDKTPLSKIVKSYIIDFIPFVNLASIAVGVLVIICIAVLKDKIFDNISDGCRAEVVKKKYENKESDIKNLTEALILDGANKSEIKEEMRKIYSHVDKKEKGSSYSVESDFSKKDYEWACAYLDAKNLIDGIFTEVTIPKEEKYEIIRELINYAKTIQDTTPPCVEEALIKETNNPVNYYDRTAVMQSEKVSNKVLEIINKHI